jgi:phage baseplate assembly protein W
MDIAYPFRLNNGEPAIVDGEDEIASALDRLLDQVVGDRLYSTSNGLNLDRYVFENVTTLTLANIRRDVTLAIARNEPRVLLNRVAVTELYQGDTRYIEIDVIYTYQNQQFAATKKQEVQR